MYVGVVNDSRELLPLLEVDDDDDDAPQQREGADMYVNACMHAYLHTNIRTYRK